MFTSNITNSMMNHSQLSTTPTRTTLNVNNIGSTKANHHDNQTHYYRIGGIGGPLVFEDISMDQYDKDDDKFSIDNFEIASKDIQFCLILLYSVTAGLALFGNVLSIMVLMRGKRSSRDLRLFLVNLSLSDILMSIFSIPFTYTDFIMGRWIFHPHLCPLVQSIQIVSVFVSIYTLTTIGIDRYIAIMKPFIVNFWTKSFAPIIILGLTWLTGAGLGLVIWFYSKAEPFLVNNVTYYDCHETWSNEKHEQIYTVGLFLVVFALPLLCLMFFYGSICYKLWYHCAPGNANAARDSAQYQAKRKVIKMLITIVALFAICWFPSHLFQLIRTFNKDLLWSFSGYDASSPKYLTIVISSHWLSMAHSFVNPIIYSFMSDNFKADAKYMIKKLMLMNCCCRRAGRRHHRSCNRAHQEEDYDYNNHHQNYLQNNHYRDHNNEQYYPNDHRLIFENNNNGHRPQDTCEVPDDDDDDDDDGPIRKIEMIILEHHPKTENNILQQSTKNLHRMSSGCSTHELQLT